MIRDLPYSRLRDTVLVAKVFMTLIFAGASIAVNVSEPLDGTAEGSFEFTRSFGTLLGVSNIMSVVLLWVFGSAHLVRL